MAPSNLQGLNLIHPAQTNNHGYDAQDLLGGPPFPDIAAQLDLWTHLPFESEEPNVSFKDDEEARSMKSFQHQHKTNMTNPLATSSSAAQFDLAAFLTSMGIDPLNAALQQQQLQHQPAPSPAVPALPLTPSIAQILALANQGQHNPGFSFSLPPPPSSTAAPEQDPVAPPPAKRQRSRKASVSTIATPTPAEAASDDLPPGSSEDKRKRNTAASARFRMKKKEREAALETKAKELEGRVNELERECEGLRRENGWLKGLVVGVTGAAQQQQGGGSPPQTTGTKRSREDAA